MAPQPTTVPTSLPPSVEEAYRRKCIQLKNRTNEVEEANDAARLRLARTKRQVEKLRVERAFLLEQLAKRTSTNVEDSDGSPSPPPTPPAKITSASFPADGDANSRKSKDKTLRTKRGHRKTSDPDEAKDGAADDKAQEPSEADISKGALELFAKTRRADAAADADDDKTQADIDVDADAEELERAWKELPESDKDKYIAEFKASLPAPSAKDDDKKASSPTPGDKADDEDGASSSANKDDARKPSEPKDADEAKDKPDTQDEDVEMGGNDDERPADAESEDKTKQEAAE